MERIAEILYNVHPVHLRDYPGTSAYTLRLWLHRHADDFSSDIGVFDHEGYLNYIGRKDDVINLGGYKISTDRRGEPCAADGTRS